MIVSDEKRFIFFEAGKTGTTSIAAVLRAWESPYELSDADVSLFEKHIPPAYARQILGEERFHRYFKFAFVRNPWDWLVSQAFHNRHGGRSRDGRGFFRRLTVDEVRELAASLPTRGVDWAPCRTQSSFLTTPDGRLLVDFVGRFEQLGEDFAEVCRLIGIEAPVLPHRMRTRHRHYSRYFDDHAAACVREIYFDDVSRFGYEFESLPRRRRVAEDVRFVADKVVRRVHRNS